MATTLVRGADGVLYSVGEARCDSLEESSASPQVVFDGLPVASGLDDGGASRTYISAGGHGLADDAAARTYIGPKDGLDDGGASRTYISAGGHGLADDAAARTYIGPKDGLDDGGASRTYISE